MIAAIFDAITEVVVAFIGVVVGLFEGLIAIFWVTTPTPALTLMGTLALIGLGVGLVYWAFKLVTSLFRQRS